MSKISTHVLDAVRGMPAAGIAVYLEKRDTSSWIILSDSATDSDGRCRDLCDSCGNGTYRLTFTVGAYFKQHERTSIYPEITITFIVDGEHPYHLPLLLSDNSYTTYRGS